MPKTERELRCETELFIVRLWDGMDGCWTDVSEEVSLEEAAWIWYEQTKGCTEKIRFGDIDYFDIFPAGTRMIWDGSRGREMFR